MCVTKQLINLDIDNGCICIKMTYIPIIAIEIFPISNSQNSRLRIYTSKGRHSNENDHEQTQPVGKTTLKINWLEFLHFPM